MRLFHTFTLQKCLFIKFHFFFAINLIYILNTKYLSIQTTDKISFNNYFVTHLQRFRPDDPFSEEGVREPGCARPYTMLDRRGRPGTNCYLQMRLRSGLVTQPIGPGRHG